MEDHLKGKVLVALGDSLIYGNKLGNDATWVNKLGKKHGMTVYNHGINGNTVALQDREGKHPPMCRRYADMEDGADYVVVLGGANDKRLEVPIGENGDRVETTFKGALNLLILGLTEKYPRAKLLFLTNYNRWGAAANGRTDLDYVLAMEEICRLWSIPCYNNFYNCGLSFRNPAQLAWIDEGLSLGLPENHHFSDAAYDWLLTKYEALLESL